MRAEEHQPNEVASHGNYVRGDSLQVMSACSPNLSPAPYKRLEGRAVVRSPQQLRLHRALDELGWTGAIDEFNDAALRKNQSIPEPILITGDGTILAFVDETRFTASRLHAHCLLSTLASAAANSTNSSLSKI